MAPATPATPFWTAAPLEEELLLELLEPLEPLEALAAETAEATVKAIAICWNCIVNRSVDEKKILLSRRALLYPSEPDNVKLAIFFRSSFFPFLLPLCTSYLQGRHGRKLGENRGSL